MGDEDEDEYVDDDTALGISEAALSSTTLTLACEEEPATFTVLSFTAPAFTILAFTALAFIVSAGVVGVVVKEEVEKFG